MRADACEGYENALFADVWMHPNEFGHQMAAELLFNYAETLGNPQTVLNNKTVQICGFPEEIAMVPFLFIQNTFRDLPKVNS